MTRTVAITGVGGGIGSATAAAFRANGWSVVGMDVRDLGDGIALDAFLQVDIGDANVDDQLGSFFATLSGLDALVNNAAVGGSTMALETDAKTWDEMMAANVRGAFLAMKAAYPLLEASGGAVVNIASVHAVATSPFAAAYAASKGAMVALTRATAIEWAPRVRVNAVLPGAIDTPMLRAGIGRRSPASSVEDAIGTLARRTPLGRVGRPDEAAQSVLFLADAERSSFITGQTLIVDGGALARLSTE